MKSSFFGNRWSNIFDPFAINVWDPSKNLESLFQENSALQKNVEKEEKNEMWHRVERSRGKLSRCFRLFENAKTNQVKASMENGVLIITVPKMEVKKPNVKTIQISKKKTIGLMMFE
uniref:SHSP domain-containing protein n=1 Tax=Gossypium raimondii TaxID=29730 RepID=A0A0D2QRM6_GOSRA|nr:hypothetical protein B456_004G042800 [Gossypium raimondii]